MRRLVAVITAVTAIEAGVFYQRHADLIALSRPADSLVADPTFDQAARTAVARERVSRRVLEHVIDVAGRKHDYVLQATALARVAQAVPDDASVQLRLAEALRAQGRLTEAEAIYTQLSAADHGVQR